MNTPGPDQQTDSGPHLGLVCITTTDEVRYKTITRTRYLALADELKAGALADLYLENLSRLNRALTFCAARGIRLYRVTSALFPMSDLDDGVGLSVLESLRDRLALVGPRAAELGIRVVVHPDQYVVLSSDSPEVVRNSLTILERHGKTFDLLGLPRSTWAAMTLHGGKAGRADQLAAVIADLPENILTRLVLENDERAYGAADILDICRRVGVPFVFDAHHHVVREKLGSYEDESVALFVAAARETWHPPGWQLVHLSNGRDSITDNRHHDLVAEVPSSYRSVPWIEVEAKTKELAIERLRADWPGAR